MSYIHHTSERYLTSIILLSSVAFYDTAEETRHYYSVFLIVSLKAKYWFVSIRWRASSIQHRAFWCNWCPNNLSRQIFAKIMFDVSKILAIVSTSVFEESSPNSNKNRWRRRNSQLHHHIIRPILYPFGTDRSMHHGHGGPYWCRVCCCLLVDLQSMGTNPAFRRLLVVVKQTAYEEYSQASCMTSASNQHWFGYHFSSIAFHIFSSSFVHEVKHPKLYDGNVLNLATKHISNASTISWIYCVGMTFPSRVLIE